jgi:hypothetical protein
MQSNGESSALQSKRLVARPTKGEGRVGDTETDLCDGYHRPLPAESVSSQHTFCSARSIETPMVSITTIVLVMLAAVLVVAGIVLSERAH